MHYILRGFIYRTRFGFLIGGLNTYSYLDKKWDDNNQKYKAFIQYEAHSRYMWLAHLKSWLIKRLSK